MWLFVSAASAAATAGTFVLTRSIIGRFGRYLHHFASDQSRSSESNVDGRSAADQVGAKIAVIVPCRASADELPELERNLTAIATQRLQDYRVICCASDNNDPSVEVLQRLASKYPNCRWLAARPGLAVSNKLNNQLTAMGQLKGDEDVWVFMDADARPDMNMVARLVDPILQGRAGVSTGYRWYLPGGGGLGSWLRAAWNLGGLPIIADPRYSYAWGGAMAVRPEFFSQLNMADNWKHALTDDMSLSGAAKAAGHHVALVPDCLVDSTEHVSIRDMLEWTTRQTLICRVYNPRMWRDLGVGEALTMGQAILAAIALAGAMSAGYGVAAVIAAVSLTGLIAARCWYQYRVLTLARQHAGQRLSRGQCLGLVALAPLVSPILLYNTVRSWVSRRMQWRGSRYLLLGPQRIEAVESKAAA